jgi:hypothetical protein
MNEGVDIPRTSPIDSAPIPVQLITAIGWGVGGEPEEFTGNASKAGRFLSESKADNEGSVVLYAWPPEARKRSMRYGRYRGTSMHSYTH